MTSIYKPFSEQRFILSKNAMRRFVNSITKKEFDGEEISKMNL